MTRILSAICPSLLVLIIAPVLSQSIDTNNGGSANSAVADGNSRRSPNDVNDSSLRGLCRDGWTSGQMKDFSGKEIPICFKVNPQPQTWHEAQTSCRKDYGFLLKLDSKATIDNVDLLSSVLAQGIRKFWSGMHTENNHLTWDDLIPNTVRPHNILNESSVPPRPWRWNDDVSDDDDEDYCGEVSLVADDSRRRRRRKRSPDDDSNIDFGNFDLSSMRDKFMSNAFRGPRNRGGGFPPTAAFQSMLTRTPIDQVAEMPSQAELPSLGIMSPTQIPGTGLMAPNIQNGGLATGEGGMAAIFGNLENEGDSGSSQFFGNTDSNGGDRMPLGNFQNGGMMVNEPPNLINAAPLNSDSINPMENSIPDSSAVEALRKLIQNNPASFHTETEASEQGNRDNMHIADAGSNVVTLPTLETGDNAENKEEPKQKDATPLLHPPVTAPQESSHDKADTSAGNNPLSLSNLADMLKQTGETENKPVINTVDGTNRNAPSVNNLATPTQGPGVLDPTFLGEKVESVVESIKDQLIEPSNAIESVVENINEGAKDFGRPIENVKSVVENINEKLNEGVPPNIDVAEKLADILHPEPIVDNVPDLGEKVADVVANTVNNAVEVPNEIIENTIGGLNDIAENINDNIAETSVSGLENLKDSTSNVFTENMASVIGDTNEQLLENIADTVNTINDNTGDSFFTGDGFNIGNNLPETITETTSDKIESLVEAASDHSGNMFGETVPDNIESMTETIADTKDDRLSEILPEIIDSIAETSADKAEGIMGESVLDDLPPPAVIVPPLPIDSFRPVAEILTDDLSDIVTDRTEVRNDFIENKKEAIEDILDNMGSQLPDIEVPDTLRNPLKEFGAPDVEDNLQDRIENIVDTLPEPIEPGLPAIFTEKVQEDRENQADIMSELISKQNDVFGDIAETRDPDIEMSDLSPPIIDVADRAEEVIEQRNEQMENIFPFSDNKGEILESVKESVQDLPEIFQDHVERVSDTFGDDGTLSFPETDTDSIRDDLPSPLDVKETLTELNDDLLPDHITHEFDDKVLGTVDDTDFKNSDIFDDVSDHLDTDAGHFDRDGAGQTVIEQVQEHLGDFVDEIDDRVENINDDLGFGTREREYPDREGESVLDTVRQTLAGESFHDDEDFNDDTKLENRQEIISETIDDILENHVDENDRFEDFTSVDDLDKQTDNIASSSGISAVSINKDDDLFTNTFDDQDVHDDIDNVHDSDDDRHTGQQVISDVDDMFDDIPSLSEDMIETARKAALMPYIKDKVMQLATCEARLPSVCFSYEVEVMDQASTCDDGWYGHVLLDTCYKVLDMKLGYRRAMLQCRKLDARLVMSASDFERQFVLIAVKKEGGNFKGARFWMESPNDKRACQYFSENGAQTTPSCNAALNVVCVKDAKSLSVLTLDSLLPTGTGNAFIEESNEVEERLFPSQLAGNTLPCSLSSAASEFPVLWFKDGVLVETKDKYVSRDLSLYLNQDLVTAASAVLSRDLALPALQGSYWCEVWDRQTLTRKRSKTYKVRFTDVLSFHGSMEIPRFSHRDELLFNMMNEKFPVLNNIEMDLKHVFHDVMPSLRIRSPDVIDEFTFIDKVKLNPNIVTYHTFFTLDRNYSPADEELVYRNLKSVLRSKLGNRNYMARLPGMTPLSAFRTLSLQSTVSCPATSLQTNKNLYGEIIPLQVYTFPKALVGEFANSVDICSQTNPSPSASARCMGDFHTGAFWSEVYAHECIEETAIDAFNNVTWGPSPYTEKLTEMAQKSVSPRNVEKMVADVAQITEVASKFTPTDINKIADVLDHATQQVTSLSEKVGQDMLRTVDKLMTSSNRETRVANVETKAANRIIKSLERFAERADIGQQDKKRFVSDNVVMEIWDLKPHVHPVIGLAAESRGSVSRDAPFRTEDIATVYNRSHLYDANVDAAIELPPEVFTRQEKGQAVSERLTMMVYRKSKLFDAAISGPDGRPITPTDEQMINLNSYIISASIAGKKLEGLTEQVKTIFKPLKNDVMGSRCVWWDFALNGNKGGWSEKGCVYDGKVNGRDVCLCDHLTNFAVLIDMYGQSERIPEQHELTLSIITVLGLSLSIIGLALTIISYCFFRKLRQGRAQQTLFNLSLALLLSMLVFLVGIKQTHNDIVCKVVAILLHYLILVSFMWMLMEAILQYLTFVKILGTYITRFTLKTVLPAWGLPLIPIIAVLSVDDNLYKGGPHYCWMALPAFYYAFAIPVTAIILINVVIFFITVVSIFRRGKGLRSNQKKQKMAITNLQAAITSFVLLGLTWIFGYLAIADARLIFQYVFTILNSMQGFFIFILFVVRKKKVREQWYFICCRGIEKDRVSRSLSASNSIPSTYSNSSNRRKNGRERDRSDSTKTVQSTYSNSSGGFTNYGYDHGYDLPFNRYDRRAFRKF